MLGALGSLIGGEASVAKAINDSKTAQRQLEKLQRHDRAMEQARELYLALYKYGRRLYLGSYKRGQDEPIFDDRIVKIETHTYSPFANTTFGYSEIRIPIQQQDLYTLPYESFLYVEELTDEEQSGSGCSCKGCLKMT
ncbi:hypothetical protein G5I_03088 [Acromyrmex echinatior]|uniref:Uncharacterized protein n=1 Tax=Acromyrmex echinatior TaxID=103372 RepID=F4WC16_ACREC|nr:hypothetical protein G5I_03088 [Acromyrmex echinatior]